MAKIKVTEGGETAGSTAKTVLPISLLTIDYPNEAINDIARKVNELIERVNTQ